MQAPHPPSAEPRTDPVERSRDELGPARGIDGTAPADPIDIARMEHRRRPEKKSFAFAVLAAADRLVAFVHRYAYYRSRGYARRSARRKADWHIR